MLKEFEDLKIVQYLKEQNVLLYGNVIQMYYICDNILKEIPKTFANYTLHDISHSVRVISYMTDLIREENLSEFSDLHIASIIFAGLMHDIGMFVSDEEYASRKQKFIESMRKFEDMDVDAQTNIIREDFRKEHGSRAARIIMSEYTSDKVPVMHLLRIPNTAYSVSEMILKVCQSHCENFEWISANLPEQDEIASYLIYPQHLAVVLRIADALDIDDRRTPYILYKMLNPQNRSRKEWEQHFLVSNYKKVKYNSNGTCEVVFRGECSNAKSDRKLREYMRWLNDEMIKINSLFSDKRDCCRLEFKIPLRNEIRPIGFEVSSLSFDLNYEKISKLLMGENLYGNKKYGLREIIQNSIDATSTMKEIFEKQGVRKEYQPLICVQLDRDKNSVIIKDNGTGMSKDVLFKYFFNVGTSYYKTDEYKNEKLSYIPIGKYGIGFLSCFMLSDEILLETKYYNSKDGYIITFEKSDKYISLSKDLDESFSSLEHGTHLVLDYKKFMEVFETEEEVVEFISEHILSKDIRVIMSDGRECKNVSTFREEKGSTVIKNDKMKISFKLYTGIEFLTDPRQLTHEKEEGYYQIDSEVIVGIEDVVEAAIRVQDEEWQSSNEDDVENEFRLEEEYNPELLYMIKEEEARVGMDVDLPEHLMCKILNENWQNGVMKTYRIPFCNRDDDVYAAFERLAVKESFELAMDSYEGQLDYFVVFGRKKPSKYCFEYLFYSIYEMPYYCKYYVEEKNHHVIKLEKGTIFFPIKHEYALNHYNIPFKIYLNGIWVRNVQLTLPIVNSYVGIEYIYVDLLSDEYEINVPRSDFSDLSKEKLGREVGKVIYAWLLENGEYIGEERALISHFIELYYG